ncbi:sigma-70 family RNA polymerase sigma factor [Fulvivirga sp. M361]|uniref:sigma-70 family RNA polymerase sigma factor n=1 Tax=Fulvivirga sp. M361 TaxID=2594266 RepID=UPI0011798D7E|nr:sigma-70 family RNA polymerase sigma factor [Fulvivirga sp. M361]TRX58764.1 sigma-70 family RNA polymerase sigma factor [Fulvivirga sp. M361]
MKMEEFDQKIASLHDTLELFTKRFTNQQEESDDLIQETMLKALTYRNKFKQNTNLKGWLFTIMRNTFINNYRKMQKGKTFLDDTKDSYYLNVPDNHTFSTPDGNYEYNDINTCMNEIKDVLLIPFKLYTEGYKYHEIADELNVPIGTVKNRIFHARKQIQEKLIDYRN